MVEKMPQFDKEKSQERLQAQTEIFARESDKSSGENKAKLLKYSEELSNIKDLNKLPPNLPVEIVGLIKKYRKYYIDFLQQQEGGADTSLIEENIKNYKEKFEPEILNLKEELKTEVEQISQEDLRKIPEYLGSGANGAVFKIKIDQEEYAAKLFYNFTQESFEIDNLSKAKGILHTPKMVSYSFADKVIITNLLPGVTLENLDLDERLECPYSDEHIIQLIDTVKELYNNGLNIDFGPSNFLYDKEEGFSVLDFYIHEKSIQKDKNRPEFWQEIINLERSLTDGISENKISSLVTARFKDTLKEKYPDIFIKTKTS